jgi:molybdenum cofactor guanylyltransferase
VPATGTEGAPACPRRLSGLVLAGGASRRMGRDKAFVEVAGVRLLDRVLAVLDGLCDEVLVASGSGRRLEVGRGEVADVLPGGGPLAGIVAGLEAATHPLVAVVAVDLPYASAAVLRVLADCWTGEPAVVPVVGGRLQPLHAVWFRDAAPALRGRLAGGQRGVIAAATALGARTAGPEVWGRADPSGEFARNVNEPHDLEDRP